MTVFPSLWFWLTQNNVSIQNSAFSSVTVVAQSDLNPEYLEMGFRGGAGLGSSSRTKRMRTSFKHHQLRTMKSYFAINHNPDAKDLKQLSQKTGLPKRVLQVIWSLYFGNLNCFVDSTGRFHDDTTSDHVCIRLFVFRFYFMRLETLELSTWFKTNKNTK